MIFSPHYTLYAKAVVGLLSIVNPMGAIPVFLSLCGERSPAERKHIARRAALAVCLILAISAWTGEALLRFFGISLPAFRAGGGLLILLMAIAMMHARLSPSRQSRTEAEEADSREDIAVVPLAIPLMAGPGAISMVIVDTHQAAGPASRLALTAVIAVVALVVWLVLHLAEPIGSRLGITGLNIATRVMGLLLAAIGIQMMAEGLIRLFPGLA
ncbi:MarC family protein [Thermodesulfobacteriota bacterium B35]